MTTPLDDVIQPVTKIKIAGKEYGLLYDFNAVALVEEQTGKNLLSAETWRSINGSLLSVLFWAGLQATQPELDLKRVRRMMSTKNAGLVSEKVQEAWLASGPEVSEEGNAPSPEAEPATRAR